MGRRGIEATRGGSASGSALRGLALAAFATACPASAPEFPPSADDDGTAGPTTGDPSSESTLDGWSMSQGQDGSASWTGWDDTWGASASDGDTGTCGNALVDPGEECDLGLLNGMGGQCRDDCMRNTCPDGYVGPGEACDDGNRVDDDACSNACAPSSCGDGIPQPGEECDGSFLGGETCQSQGFSGGRLSCTDSCMLDTQNCSSCGNGSIEPGEECEAGSVGDQTCASLGFSAGQLACDDGCMFDVSGCCTGSGGRCDDVTACCDGLSCQDGACCASNRQPCAANSDCCSGICAQSFNVCF